jgi:O-antigen/teichoic acid export membrane protein
MFAFLSIIIKKITHNNLNRNIFSGVLLTGLLALIGLLRAPLYLYFISFAEYGILSILALIPELVQLGMLGVAPALVKLSAEELGKGNKSGIVEFLNTAIIFVLAASILVLPCVFLLQGQIAAFIDLDLGNADIFFRCIPWVCGLLIVTLLNQLFFSITVGIGRIDISNMLRFIIALINLLVAFLFLLNTSSVKSILQASVVTEIISLCYLFFILRRSGYQTFAGRIFSTAKFKRLLSYGIPIVLSTLFSGGLMISCVKALLSRYCGIQSVGYFNLAWSIFCRIIMIINLGFQAILPEITKLRAQNEDEQNIAKLNRKLFRMVCLCGTIICVLSLVLSPIIFKIWLQSRYRLEIVYMFNWLLPGLFFLFLSLITYYNALSLERMKLVTFYGFINFAIVLVSMVLVFQFLQIQNPVWASCAVSIGQICATSLLFLFARNTSPLRQQITGRK